MFTNREGCTIYERTIQNRSPVFIRHETGRIYYEETRGQKEGKDREPENKVLVIIPDGATEYIPKTGDKIVGEIIPDETPPVSAFTVFTAKDFRYGSAQGRHIEVNAR
ncbi:MAG: hypothetical protein MJZ03_05635 [archaeon]|nr:hypothetical protein [archaeon]